MEEEEHARMAGWFTGLVYKRVGRIAISRLGSGVQVKEILVDAFPRG